LGPFIVNAPIGLEIGSLQQHNEPFSPTFEITKEI
jgi:hypothetical protein